MTARKENANAIYVIIALACLLTLGWYMAQNQTRTPYAYAQAKFAE